MLEIFLNIFKKEEENWTLKVWWNLEVFTRRRYFFSSNIINIKEEALKKDLFFACPCWEA